MIRLPTRPPTAFACALPANPSAHRVHDPFRGRDVDQDRRVLGRELGTPHTLEDSPHFTDELQVPICAISNLQVRVQVGRAVIPVSSRSAARLIELANSPLAEDELREAVAKAIHDRGGCTGVGVTVDKWSGLEIRLKRLLILSLGHQCQTCDPELKARLRKLIELEMRSPDQELRDQAIIEIADLASDAPAVQPVVGPAPLMVQKILDKAMNSQDDDDIELVNREVKELREEGRARLVQELRPLIRGKDVEKRARALILLGMTGASAKPAVGDLVEVLSSENDAEVLNNVCNTLTMIGPPAAPALDTLQRLAERYPDVKHAAELAIVSIKRKP